ncbi:hypothetical protein PR048_006049 [Dryococelus australis]|uniref:Uncharacterized protein n=1 Tax=Dryococelus australis TaxID=614101 RepID=A0ABQ9IAV1_9NEOP|nr:hypothetical protein PR048_006049 [Dryococelus australis]
MNLPAVQTTNFISPSEIPCQDEREHWEGRRGALEAERLAFSPPTQSKRVQSPAGSLPDLRMWESCQTMPLAGGFFFGDLPFLPPFHSGAAPYSPQSPSSALKTSLLSATKISSLTHSLSRWHTSCRTAEVLALLYDVSEVQLKIYFQAIPHANKVRFGIENVNHRTPHRVRAHLVQMLFTCHKCWRFASLDFCAWANGTAQPVTAVASNGPAAADGSYGSAIDFFGSGASSAIDFFRHDADSTSNFFGWAAYSSSAIGIATKADIVKTSVHVL